MRADADIALAIMVATAAACNCSSQPHLAEHNAATFAVRTLGSQPLQAEIPEDARVEDLNILGPDDGGLTSACVISHELTTRETSMCGGGVWVVHDTHAGRAPENAGVNVTTIDEDETRIRSG
ncbi:MAG: hypothetical protein JWO36_3607, partial [Myxococcales bacterium]|nr:hypothetical protein [Myxococcales bacterium]